MICRTMSWHCLSLVPHRHPILVSTATSALALVVLVGCAAKGADPGRDAGTSTGDGSEAGSTTSAGDDEVSADGGAETETESSGGATAAETETSDTGPDGPLNVDALREGPSPCVPLGVPLAEFLDGGDGTAVSCELAGFGDGTCPLGDGNGVMPEGVALDEEACVATGAVVEDAAGTWVWIVRATQGGTEIFVPFCATGTAAVGHEVAVEADGRTLDAETPGRIAHAPAGGAFAGPTYRITATEAICDAGCEEFGAAWSVTCSPLDPPFSADPFEAFPGGFTHTVSADHPMESDQLQDRPWAMTWTFHYCHGPTAEDCSGEVTLQNAQSRYVYSFISWPVDGGTSGFRPGVRRGAGSPRTWVPVSARSRGSRGRAGGVGLGNRTKTCGTPGDRTANAVAEPPRSAR